ncbi:hypothetical protein ACFQJ5_16590 [Halomicroarcula sp. GCM10025324]|uniref:hypothetical protein n=1 Tax=Haloarcula TaxID=2237 RepID=UPI0023E87F52|nr:hypothetical protein [Halomicroarcula sp. ZS-22-S1]
MDELNAPDADVGSINKLPTIVERLRPVTFLNINDLMSTDKIDSDGGWFSRKHLEEYETNYAAKKRYELMKSILPAENLVEEFEIDQCPNPWLIISLKVGGDSGIEPYYAVTVSGNLYLQTGIKDPDAYEDPVAALKEQLRTGETMTSSEFENIWPPIVRLAGEHESNNSVHKINAERNVTLEETVADISASSAKEAVRTVYPKAKIPTSGVKEWKLDQGPEIPVDTYQAYGWTSPSLESYTPPVAYAKSNLPEYSGDRKWTFYINYLCIKFDDRSDSEEYIKKLFEWADVGYSNERPYLGATSESYGTTYKFTNSDAMPNSPVPFSGHDVTLSGSVCVVSDWILNPT